MIRPQTEHEWNSLKVVYIARAIEHGWDAGKAARDVNAPKSCIEEAKRLIKYRKPNPKPTTPSV